MKRIIYLSFVMMIGCLVPQSCYDDTEIWDIIENHEYRLLYLEEQCEQMNTNITSIQYLLTSQTNGDYIVSIKPYVEDGKDVGYVITFNKGGSIVIYHGKDGLDGEAGTPGEDGKEGTTPVIGVKKAQDGLYYWTVNGEWILGEDGEKIKAVGVDGNDGMNGSVPVVGVKRDTDGIYYWTINGEWLLGEVGEKIKAEGSDGAPEVACCFLNIEETSDGYVAFTLVDGTLIKVPTWEVFDTQNTFAIVFDRTEYLISNIECFSVPFVLTGVVGETEISAMVVSDNNVSQAEIEMVNESNGLLHIYTEGNHNLDVLVIASNNGRTIHKLIKVMRGELIIYDYCEVVEYIGGIIEIPIATNYDYDVVISEECSEWISYVETKSELRSEVLVLSISPNYKGEGRYGEIELREKYLGGILARIYFYQEAFTMPVPYGITLSVDKTHFDADGIDGVTFAVSSNGEEIKTGVEFYNDRDERIDIKECCFTTTTPGTYSIYAKYAEAVSNTINVLAKDETIPEYISLTGETWEDNIICAVLGLDGSILYYHQSDSIPGMISKISKYNNYTKELEYIINFGEDGNISNMLTPELAIVLGNYHENLFDAVVLTKDGEVTIVKDIEYGTSAYLLTKSPSGVEIANMVVSGVAVGLEVAAIASVGVAAAGPISITMAAIGAGCLAYDIASSFDLIEEGGIVGELSTQLLCHFGNLTDMGINPPNNKLELMASLANIVAYYVGIAETMEGDSKETVDLGKTTLKRNAYLSATLTWNGPADIDLHCDGPSGHIYYANMDVGDGYLDYDNTTANGPETIYYSHPDDGSYSFFIHYFAENSGVNSVDYTVSLSSYGETEEYSGTISGQGSIVHIHTVLIGGKTNASLMSIEVEDLNNLPAKSIIE